MCVSINDLNVISKQIGRKIVPFVENSCYTVSEVAEILGRSERVVRAFCHKRALNARMEAGGYFITGWALRAFLENRCEIPPRAETEQAGK